jgi:hypothetical protein
MVVVGKDDWISEQNALSTLSSDRDESEGGRMAPEDIFEMAVGGSPRLG